MVVQAPPTYSITLHSIQKLMKSFPPLLLLIACFSILGSSCGSLKEPEFRSIENIRLTRLGTRQSKLALDLNYHNPNKSRLKLKEAEGDAWLDGNFLGHFTVDTLIEIPRVADFRLPITLELDMSQVLKNSLATFLKSEVMVRVEGKAKLGKGGLYIRYPLRYEGKQNLSRLLR